NAAAEARRRLFLRIARAGHFLDEIAGRFVLQDQKAALRLPEKLKHGVSDPGQQLVELEDRAQAVTDVDDEAQVLRRVGIEDFLTVGGNGGEGRGALNVLALLLAGRHALVTGSRRSRSIGADR